MKKKPDAKKKPASDEPAANKKPEESGVEAGGLDLNAMLEEARKSVRGAGDGGPVASE